MALQHAGPCLWPAGRDDQLAGPLLATLGGWPFPSERVSAPKMLWGSRGATEPLQTWAARELERQDSPDYLERGHDILEGR